jgi:hypothetical protein
MSTIFSDKLVEVLSPIRDLIADQTKMLAKDPRSEDWKTFRERNKSILSKTSAGCKESRSCESYFLKLTMLAVSQLRTAEALLTRELTIKCVRFLFGLWTYVLPRSRWS